MKGFLLSLTFLFHLMGSSQSPGLTIDVIMDTLKTQGHHYKIEMKICEPKKMTEKGSWFSHDTSTIDFASLKPADIICGEYFDKGMPELISGIEEEIPFNRFKFSNQVFAWEKIFVFKISDWSSRGRNPEMYIVIPMKYKSFRTHIDITDIEFLPGKVMFLTQPNALYDESKLTIRPSVKDMQTVEVKNFQWREILEQK